ARTDVRAELVAHATVLHGKESALMKILLATDGSPCSERAVEETARRPWPADSQLRVVSVVEPPAPLVAEPYMEATNYFEEVERLKRQQAGEALERAAEKLRRGRLQS